MDGKISVNKDEKPVKHGAYAGLAAGAGAAILFPPLLLVTAPAAIGAGVGAWMGHLAHGMSRKDAKAMAAQLQPGQAALIVVGIDEDSARVEQATGASLSHVTKHLEGSDFDDAEREAMASLEAQQAPSASPISCDGSRRRRHRRRRVPRIRGRARAATAPRRHRPSYPRA